MAKALPLVYFRSGHDSLGANLVPKFFALLLGVLVSLLSVWLIADRHDDYLVVLSIVTSACVGIYFYLTLWKRDGSLRLFDIGSITLLAILIYLNFPLITMTISGYNFTPFNSTQLFINHPTPEEIAPVAWRYVVFLTCFAFSYLKFRKSPIPYGISFEGSAKFWLKVLLILFVIFFVVLKLFEIVTGLSMDATYDEQLGANYGAIKALPLIWQQVIGKFDSIFFVIKIGLMFCLISLWRKNTSKVALAVILSGMLIDHLLRMRARTELIVLFLTVILLYDQFVRRVSLKRKFAIGVILFGFFLFYGAIRGHASFTEGLSEYLNMSDQNIFWNSANEFETLFAGTYDICRLIHSGSAIAIPWYSWLYDVTLLIPSQLLPFEKWDPQLWYVSNYDYFPGFFMYNPICQAIVGFDWIELVLRGCLLGFVFAKIHAWYLKRCHEFWPTLFYLWMTVGSFYSIRSSSFGFAIGILQTFLPAFLLAKFVSVFFRASRFDAINVRNLRQTHI